MRHLLSILFFLSVSLVNSLGYAEQVTVAVASNFSAPMKAIVNAFEQQTQHKVRLAFGSSGKFFAQIKQNAPFDVFLSADQEKPNALKKDGLIVAGSQFTYAIGALVLWSPKPGLVDEQGSVLQKGGYHKLALANPKLAPYGKAAVEVLTELGLLEKTRPHWVQGENISQTYQFVASGNVDLGFLALSQVMTDGKIAKGSYWQIPDKFYQPIKQDAVLLKRGKENLAARELLAFLKSEQVRSIAREYGYQTTLFDI